MKTDGLAFDFTGVEKIAGYADLFQEAESAQAKLLSGEYQHYLGWLDLPVSQTSEQITSLKNCASELAASSDVIVVLGIGGSYLGAKAVIKALTADLPGRRNEHHPQLVFAGNTLSSDYTAGVLELTANRSWSIVVISKSGNTIETAIAFRLFRKELEKRYGAEQAAKRIIAITDASSGRLKQTAVSNGYATFVIPDDVGGRFSVLTPVGLLPVAIAGIDIEKLLAGAATMRENLFSSKEFSTNPAMQYAACRKALYKSGFRIELLAAYEPRLRWLTEWWKQLFGESEGKDGKGLFPASMSYAADLHSLGQYIQEGCKILFETILSVDNASSHIVIDSEEGDPDGLNYIAGKSLQQINNIAEQGVRTAHIKGGVANIRIGIDRLDEHNVGALLYFFEYACAISGIMLGVNPFDQPGVEAYKQEMAKLLA